MHGLLDQASYRLCPDGRADRLCHYAEHISIAEVRTSGFEDSAPLYACQAASRST
jgi:hypothetical protein